MKLDNQNQKELLLRLIENVPVTGNIQQVTAAVQQLTELQKSILESEIETVK